MLIMLIPLVLAGALMAAARRSKSAEDPEAGAFFLMLAFFVAHVWFSVDQLEQQSEVGVWEKQFQIIGACILLPLCSIVSGMLIFPATQRLVELLSAQEREGSRP